MSRFQPACDHFKVFICLYLGSVQLRARCGCTRRPSFVVSCRFRRRYLVYLGECVRINCGRLCDNSTVEAVLCISIMHVENYWWACAAHLKLVRSTVVVLNARFLAVCRAYRLHRWVILNLVSRWTDASLRAHLRRSLCPSVIVEMSLLMYKDDCSVCCMFFSMSTCWHSIRKVWSSVKAICIPE